MKAQRPTQNLITPVGVVTYPKLFEKGLNWDKSGPASHYTASIAFRVEADLTDLENAIVNVAKQFADFKGMSFPKAFVEDFPNPKGTVKTPLQTDRAKLDKMGLDDNFDRFISLKSPNRIGLRDATDTRELEPEEIYAGVLGRFDISVFPYFSSATNCGITCWMNAFQKVGDGNQIGGRRVSFGVAEDVEMVEL